MAMATAACVPTIKMRAVSVMPGGLRTVAAPLMARSRHACPSTVGRCSRV